MPIISWTQADILQQKVADPGSYQTALVATEGPKASNSGKGINLFVTIRILEGPLAGKEIQVCFSSGVKATTVLGTMQFFPMHYMAQIDAAVKGILPRDIVPGSTDTDLLINKPFTTLLATDVSDGKPMNVITGFLPVGSQPATVPF